MSSSESKKLKKQGKAKGHKRQASSSLDSTREPRKRRKTADRLESTHQEPTEFVFDDEDEDEERQYAELFALPLISADSTLEDFRVDPTLCEPHDRVCFLKLRFANEQTETCHVLGNMPVRVLLNYLESMAPRSERLVTRRGDSKQALDRARDGAKSVADAGLDRVLVACFKE